MTREEIMQLNTDYLNGCESEHKMNELFNYVLELQKHEQEPCEDCISRAEAIDVVKKWFDKIKLNGDICLDGIASLPSVTPQQKIGWWVSNKIQGEVCGQIVRAFTCSECGAISVFRMMDGKIVNGDSCANCRAKMQEVE